MGSFLRNKEPHRKIGALDVMSPLFLEVSKLWLDGIPEVGRTCSSASAQPVAGPGRTLYLTGVRRTPWKGRSLRGSFRTVRPLPSLGFCGPEAALLPALPPVSQPCPGEESLWLFQCEVSPQRTGLGCVCASLGWRAVGVFSGSWAD